MGSFNEEYAKKVYGGLIKRGYTVDELGDEAKFVERMGKESNRKILFDVVQRRGNANMGSWDRFNGKMSETPTPQNTFTASELGLDDKDWLAQPVEKRTYGETQTPLRPEEPVVENTTDEVVAPVFYRREKTPLQMTENEYMQRVQRGLDERKYDFSQMRTEQGMTAGREDVIKKDGRYYTPMGSYDSYLDATEAVDDAVEYNGVSVGQMKAYFSAAKDKQAEYAKSIGKTPEEIEGAYKAMNKSNLEGQMKDLYQRIGEGMRDVNSQMSALQREHNKDRGFGTFVKDAVMGASVNELPVLRGQIPGSTLEITPEWQNLKKEDAQLWAAARQFNTAQQMIDAAKSGDFNQGFHNAIGELIKGGVVQDMQDLNAIQEVSKKYESGEKLTKNEEMLLESLAMGVAVASQYQDELSAWYNAGKMTGEMIPYMVEMWMNPMSKLGKKLGQKVIDNAKKKYGRDIVKHKVGVGIKKGLANVGGSIAGGYGMALTTGLPSVITGVQERTMGDAKFVKEGGNVEYAGRENAEGVGSAIYKETTQRMLDNASEMLGAGYLGKPFNWIRNAGKGTKLLGWIDNVASSKYGKAFGDFMEATKWNGPLEEFMEELHVGIASPLLTGEGKVSDFFKGKNLATVAIGVAVPGAAFATLATIQGGKDGAFKAGAKERWKMQLGDIRAREAWGEKWDDLRSKLENPSLEEVDKTLTEINNDKTLTPEQKVSAFEYGIYSLQYKTARGVADAFESRKDGISAMLRDIYFDAYSSEPTGVVALSASEDFKTAEMNVRTALGLTNGEDVDAYINNISSEDLAQGNKDVLDLVNNYQAAKARFEGIQDKFQDTREEQYRESDNSINSRANNGVVFSVTTDNGVVFITGGKVALNDEGMIDYVNSKDLVAMFPDGKKKPVKNGSLQGKVNIENAEELKAVRRAEIDAKWKADFDNAETAANELQKREAGLLFEVADELGTHTVEVLEEGADESKILFDGEETPIGTEELNQWREMAGVSQTENGELKTENEQASPENGNVEGESEVALLVESIPTETWGKVKRTAYHVVPIERTLEDLESNELTGEEKIQFAQANIDEINSELQKILKQEPKMGADIQAYKAAKAQWTIARDEWQKRLDYYNELLNRLKQPVQTSEVAPAVESVAPQATNEMQPVQEAVAPTAEEVADAQAFAIAAATNTAEAYQTYLDNNPDGAYRDGARAGMWMIEDVNPETRGLVVDALLAANEVLSRVPAQEVTRDNVSQVEGAAEADAPGQSGEVEPVGNSEQLTNDVKTEDVNQSEDNLEMVAEGENAPLAEISNNERAEMEARIVDWLSEENLERAEGKTREEIFDEFGNELEPIAYIPKQYISLVSADLKDQRIYCGKGYFIDHALRNHAKDGKQLNVEDVDVSKYLNIQSVLDNPDSVKETYVDGKRTVVFIKKIGRYFAELTQVEEDGKIVLHKSMFNQKKEPYAKLNDIRSKGTSSEGGVSSISHTADAVPAISLESRGDVVSNSTVSSVSEDRNYVSNAQENTQKSDENAENRGEITETTANPTDSEPTEQPETNDVANAGPVNMETLQLNMSDEDFNALLSSGDKAAIGEYLAEMDGLLRIGVGSPLDGQMALREEYRKAVEQYGKENIPAEVMDDLNSRMQPYSDLSRAIFDRKYALQDKLREIEASEVQAKEVAEKEAKAEHKQTAFGGFLAGKTDLGAGSAEKALSKKYNFDGKVMTVAEFVEDAVGNGNVKLSAIEEPKYKGASRAAWNRMDARQQEADAKRVKESGTKTVYTVNDHDLGKTAYDYAKFLLDKKAEQKKAATEQMIRERIEPFAKKKDAEQTTVKIEDVGEKIGGARKDIIRQYADKIKLDGKTFSTMFPKPDIDKLVEAGLPKDKVAAVKAMYDNAKREFEIAKKRRGKDRALQASLFYAMYAKNVLTGEEGNFDLTYNGFVFTEWGKEFMKANIALYKAVFNKLGTDYGKVDLRSYFITPLAAGMGKNFNLKKLNEENSRMQQRMAEMDGRKVPEYKDGDLINFVGEHYSRPSDQFETLEEAVNTMVERISKEVKVDEAAQYKVESYWKRDAQGRADYSKIFVGVKVRGFGTVDLMEFKSSNEARQWLDEHGDDFQQMAAAKEVQVKAENKKPLPKYSIEYTLDRVNSQYAVVANFGRGKVHTLRTFDFPEDDARARMSVFKDEVMPFLNSQEAVQAANEYAEELQQKKSAPKNVVVEKNSKERVGVDWRNGQDATTEMFVDVEGKEPSVFGFRALEFGNYVSQKERQQYLNDIYDALMDMSEVLGVSPRALSLGGKLALAVGARGTSGASGHYEPYKNVINITKTKGAGVLAHEWLHALDRYFSNFDENAVYPNGVMYATQGMFADDTRQEVKDAFEKVMLAVKASDYRDRSMRLGEYWASEKELAARALQDYIIRKLDDRGQKNDFLSNHVAPEEWDGDAKGYPFPLGEDAKRIADAFDNLFATLEEKTTDDGNVVLYKESEKNSDVLDSVEKGLSLEQTNDYERENSRLLSPRNDVVRILDAYNRAGRGERPTGDIADIIRRFNEERVILADTPLLRDVLKLLRRLTNNEISTGLLPFFEKRVLRATNETHKKEYQSIVELIKRFVNRNERRAVIKELSGAELGEEIPLSVIDKLFGLYNSDNNVAQLYERVRGVAEQIGLSFNFSEVKDEITGLYSLADNEISLNAHILYSPYLSNQGKAATIVHEMIHSVSCYAVMEYENGNPNLSPELKKAAESIIDIYNKKVKGNPDLVHGVYDAETKSMQPAPDYGTKSAYEMVAELSNPDFAEKLKSIEYDGRNVWRRIWDAIKSIFVGRKQENGTAYDALMKSFDALVDNFDSKAYEQARGNEAVFDRIADNVSATMDVPIDNVPTQPLTFRERITQSVLDASARNKDALEKRADALRMYGTDLKNLLKRMMSTQRWYEDLPKEQKMAVGKELWDVRRGIAASQRVYDKATIDTLVKMAKMYFQNAQLLGHITPYEAGRIMSVLHNATGKSDISNEADKLVNILVDAHTKELAAILDKAVKTKATKVNMSGVEVMGSLDKRGQIMTSAYKDALERDIDSIEKMMIDAEQRMGDPNPEYAKEAEAELEGLLLAHEYKKEIEERKQEIKDLGKELELAERDAKSGALDRKAFREMRKEAQEAVLESKLEIVDAYHNLIRQFSEGLRESSARAKAFRQAQIDRVKDIQHNANSDMEGRPADIQTELPKRWNSWLARTVLAPFGTLQQMLKKFGEKSVDGKGYLYNRFMPLVTKASDREFRKRAEARLKLNAKLSEIFGKKKKYADLLSLDRKMPGMSIRYINGSEYDPATQQMIPTYNSVEMSQGQLLYLYMINKMSDGRMKLRKMGITEEVMAEVKEMLDERFIKFADWVQDSFLKDKRAEYNEVYERLFGAPMAAIENYFPIKVKKSGLNEAVDVAQQEIGKPSTITGSVIKRTKNTSAIDLSANAFNVLMDHIDDMEHWAAFAELNRDINTLLSYKHFRNQVKNMSTVRYGSGETLWKNFENTARIATQNYKPKTGDIDKAVVNLTKAVSASKINFRVYTALKQLLSAPAFWTEGGFKEFVKAYTHPGEAWRWAIDNLPGFKERWEGRMAGNERLKPTEKDWTVWRNKWVEKATRGGMWMNAFVDAHVVSVGAKAVFETKFEELKNAGYTEEKAKEKALQAAAEVYNESQQSSEGAYLSAMQMDRTLLSAALTTFKNSNFGYTRKTAQAIANLSRKTKKGYKEEAIAFMTKQLVRDGLTEEQAKAYAERMYKRSTYKDAADVAMYGFALNILWALGGKAIYLLFGDDDEEKKDMALEALGEGLLGPVQGIGAGDAFVNLAKAAHTGEWRNFSLPGVPAISDVENIAQLFSFDAVRGATELLNMLVAAGVGVNPAVFTEVYAALADAEGFSPEELGLIALRFMSAPTGQVDQLLLDKAMENSGEDLENIMLRYAEYKMNKNTPITQWGYSDEGEQKAMMRYMKRFDTLLGDRLENVVENETAFNMFYDNAEPLMKAKLAKKRQMFLEKDKDTAKTFEKMSAEEMVNSILWGKKPDNEIYYGMANMEDVDEDYFLKHELAKFKKIYDAGKDLDSEAKAKYYSEHKREIDMYQKLRPINNFINARKKDMMTRPNDAEDLMTKIRGGRTEAIKLINDYGKK